MISDEAVARALRFQRSTMESLRLGTILLNWDLLVEDALLAALSRYHRCPSVDWETLSKASPEALRCLPAPQAIRLGAVPYAIEAGSLRIAFRNPSDLAVIDEAAQITGRRVLPSTTTEVRLALAQQKFYGQPLPFRFKPVLQKLERKKPLSTGDAPAAAIPAPKSDGADSFASTLMENIQPLAETPAAVAEIAEPAGPWSGAPAELPPIAPIEIPEFPVPAGAPSAVPPPGARRRDEILGRVLDFLLPHFPRVILLGAGKTALTGWAGRGPGLSPESVAAILIPKAGGNVLVEVANSGVPHFGPVSRERFAPALAAVLGTETGDCAVVPISVLDTVAGLLYADRVGRPMSPEDFAALARAAASAATLLSDFVLQHEGEE
jgi:uncharacterized protein (DUF1778 family)